MEESAHREQVRRMVLLGVLSASATALQIVESPLPRLLPWLKPGLSNVLVLYGIIRFSPWFGCQIVILRTILTGLFLGILFSPPNLLSFIGGCASAGVMSFFHAFFSEWFSIYGISILGALSNNIAQIAAVGYIMGDVGVPLWLQFVVMIWISIPSGFIVGKITAELVRRMP